MPTLQPEQATFLLQTILPSLQREHATTRRVIDAVPADKGDYRPDSVCMSAFQLCWHIAAADIMFLNAVASGEFQYPGTPPESVRTSADVSAWYGAEFDKVAARLQALTGDQLVRTLDFRGRFQLPAIQYLQFGLSHTIHHRGQLSVYLRPMGAKVPSIYGESYDDAQARKAAGG